MTTPATVVNRGEATELKALVRGAMQLDISVAGSVSDELALYDRLTRDPLGAQRDLQAAHAALGAAEVDKIDGVLDKLAEASLRTFAAQGLGESIHQIALGRLRAAVYTEMDNWEISAVEIFNQKVADHKLNEAGPTLPDLLAILSPIDLSHSQSQAVQTWRNAADALHEIFSFYARIATLNGHDVGPGGADELSTNLSMACRLGDPGSWATAESAAVRFASIGAGSDAARKYGVLQPFCIPAICGYELRLSTSSDAANIRRSIQPAAGAGNAVR
jgi:hypothetical protein